MTAICVQSALSVNVVGNIVSMAFFDSTTTVKPLYSEQSRDPKKCSLYGGVHPRGRRYVHAHMCLKYNLHILKLTSQISFAFKVVVAYWKVKTPCTWGMYKLMSSLNRKKY